MSAAEAGGEAARIVFDTVRVSSLISGRPASLRLSAFNLRRTSIPGIFFIKFRHHYRLFLMRMMNNLRVFLSFTLLQFVTLKFENRLFKEIMRELTTHVLDLDIMHINCSRKQ